MSRQVWRLWLYRGHLNFKSSYPEVTIELHSTPSDPSERITTSDDLAILVSDTESVCYGAKELGRVPTYICASPKYILRNSERRKIEDLSMHRIVINSAWMCPSLIYDPNTLEAQAHPTGLRFRVDEMEALRDAAIGEVGIVLGLPKYLFDPEEKREESCQTLCSQKRLCLFVLDGHAFIGLQCL